MTNNFRVLWAKKPQSDDESEGIMPLPVHMKKTADVAGELWEFWLPPLLKSKIDKKLLIFLAYSHDLGKCSPGFQMDDRYSKSPQTDEKIRNDLKRAGFPLKESYGDQNKTRHELVSHAILKRNGFDDSLCVIVGGHHGMPSGNEKIGKLSSYKKNCGFNCSVWMWAQDALLAEALEVSGLTKEEALDVKVERPLQVILSALVILADWIASSDYDVKSLPPMWKPEILEDVYEKRFGIEIPRPVQEELVRAVNMSNSPGIFIVEAPMGEGKTEAALAAAEILARKVGSRGIYFALPSQATSNAMLSRVKDWIGTFDNQDEALSIRLAHGKADLNEEYEGIKLSAYRGEKGENVTVHDWLRGRKKGMLADFTIGTIDHVLMAGLKQKHLVLRHLGLANKVLIIDECHAYDVYMESYLLTALKWLGAYGVPVIILSATLPTTRRVDLIGAYLNRSREENFGVGETWAETTAYPLITYTNEKEINSLPIATHTKERSWQVNIEKIEDEKLLTTLEQSLSNDGYAGVIFNTVRRAQAFYNEAVRKYGEKEVVLLHSGFMATDRAKREKSLVSLLGKEANERSQRRVIIGTQVFEQSLDIDFDVMFTELCPMDLLLQRIGRLHRHKRGERPAGLEKPSCYVIGAKWGAFDEGSSYVYGEYLLMRTCAALPNTINIPGDIPKLVADVYTDDVTVNIPEEFLQDYHEATKGWGLKSENRESRAKAFQIKGGLKSKTIMGWLDSEFRDDRRKYAGSDIEGEAAVRDGVDSLEVLLIQRRNGQLSFLPWVQDGEMLPYDKPDDEQARAIAGCSIRLPAVLNYSIDKVIKSIEADMETALSVESWYESYWLKGQLILIMDEEQNAILGNYCIHYNQQTGLSYWKENSE